MGYMLKRTGALKYAIGGRQLSHLLEWGLAQVPTSYLPLPPPHVTSKVAPMYVSHAFGTVEWTVFLPDC